MGWICVRVSAAILGPPGRFRRLCHARCRRSPAVSIVARCLLARSQGLLSIVTTRWIARPRNIDRLATSGAVCQSVLRPQAGGAAHDHKREIQAVVQRRGQLLEQGLPKRLHGTPAWIGSTKKASDFKADELLVTTGRR